MTAIAGFLAVFGLGVVALPAAFPMGAALGMSPALVALITAMAGFASFFAVILVGEPVRRRLVERYHLERDDGSPSRVARLWHRYGAAGVGLAAPLLVGVPIATALGITLGIPAKRLGLYVSITILLSCTAYAALWYLGLMGVDAVRG